MTMKIVKRLGGDQMRDVISPVRTQNISGWWGIHSGEGPKARNGRRAWLSLSVKFSVATLTINEL